MKQLLLFVLLALLTFSVASCSESSGGEYDNKTKQWGYISAYTGYTSQSTASQLSDREKIAAGLVLALNYSNNIYTNATTAVLPSLFDSTSYKRTDNGTCKIPGTREYNVRANTYSDAETFINFYSYCIENGVAPVINSVTIKSASDSVSVLKEITTDSSSLRMTTHTFLPKLVDVNVRRGNMLWDNTTITAGIISRDKTVNTVSDNVTSEQVHVGLDILSDKDVWRTDLFIKNSPTFSKSIQFYNNKYGYVDADVTWFTNGTISQGDVITMIFRDNKTCVFMPQELGTKLFDCKAKK